MTKIPKDDPKNLLRCPSGCGNPVDFTALSKCIRCGAVRCDVCMKKYKQRPYCKPCFKAQHTEDSRKGKPTGE